LLGRKLTIVDFYGRCDPVSLLQIASRATHRYTIFANYFKVVLDLPFIIIRHDWSILI